MEFAAFKRELLAHYIAMASLPAWKAHAWQSANDLAREHSCLFADLPALLTQAMTTPKDSK